MGHYFLDIQYYVIQHNDSTKDSIFHITVGMQGVYSKILGDPEVTASLYCNYAFCDWEGFMICIIYWR